MRQKIILIFSLILSISCATQQKIVYLQGSVVDTLYATPVGGEIRLRPDDMISIVVSSKSPELASIFNLQGARSTTLRGGSLSNGGGSSAERSVICYTVDPAGTIDYPIFGRLRVEGMTKFEIAEMIKAKILESGMLKDPIVNVEFENLTFATLGEVGSPGQYEITKDRTTILEALSMSGDLTINGVRDRLFVIRNEEGGVKTYCLDLRSTEIYHSPAYYIQQSDLIYVEPNKQRSNQSSVNAGTLSTPSFWMSITSFLLTLTLLFTN